MGGGLRSRRGTRHLDGFDLLRDQHARHMRHERLSDRVPRLPTRRLVETIDVASGLWNRDVEPGVRRDDTGLNLSIERIGTHTGEEHEARCAS